MSQIESSPSFFTRVFRTASHHLIIHIFPRLRASWLAFVHYPKEGESLFLAAAARPRMCMHVPLWYQHVLEVINQLDFFPLPPLQTYLRLPPIIWYTRPLLERPKINTESETRNLGADQFSEQQWYKYFRDAYHPKPDPWWNEGEGGEKEKWVEKPRIKQDEEEKASFLSIFIFFSPLGSCRSR